MEGWGKHVIKVEFSQQLDTGSRAQRAGLNYRDKVPNLGAFKEKRKL